MGVMAQWFADNWFDLFSSVGIVASLLFTAVSLHSETKTRRVANLLAVTANYSAIWKEFINEPKLRRLASAVGDSDLRRSTARMRASNSRGSNGLGR